MSVGRWRIQLVRATPRVGGVHMGRPKGWTTAVTGRPAQRVQGHPGLRREHRQAFWAAIARGLSTEDAAAVAEISRVAGARLFNQGGGMATVTQLPISCRFLSFAEREDIALHRASGCGVREIARLTGRSPSTISRELRRNGATHQGRLAYRASSAQWHADCRARRPKVATLVANEALRDYVQAPLGCGAPDRRNSREGTKRHVAQEEGAALSGSPVGAGMEP